MTIQRHTVRITMEIEVVVDSDHEDRGSWDAEKERALLLAIMADPEALRQEVVSYALMEVEGAAHQLDEGIGDTDDVVRLVLPRLPDDLRAYFQRYLDERLISEATDWVNDAFTHTVRKASLEVLPA